MHKWVNVLGLAKFLPYHVGSLLRHGLGMQAYGREIEHFVASGVEVACFFYGSAFKGLDSGSGARERSRTTCADEIPWM